MATWPEVFRTPRGVGRPAAHVTALGPRHTDEVLSLCAQDPAARVFVASRIEEGVLNARGQALPETEGASPAKAWWDDAAAPSGQVGILVSLHDQRLYVLRDGVMIGESPLRADALPAFQGTTLFVMGQGFSETPSPLDTQQRLHQWTAYPLLGQDRAQATPDLLATPSLPMALPTDFARQLYQVLVPGTTLLVTSLPAVRPSAAESGLQPVLESEPATPTLKKS